MRRGALALALAAALAGCGASKERAAPAPGGGEAAGAIAPVLPREPWKRADAPPAAPKGRWLTARLLRRAVLRAAPGGRRLAVLRQVTEFGSPAVLAVVARRPGWLSVLTARRTRPGWIPEDAAALGATDYSARVDRTERRLELLRGKKVVRRLPVAIGRPGYPTPVGRFAVTDELKMKPGGPYGCCAIALTGRQTHLPAGWTGGDRIAIHGTPATESIGQAASLGCLRAHDRDVRALIRALPLGAPVVVRD
jgi:lipoprotein-anchoring transpeptidase ErfK/SrfK